jgi:hypothetical protein
MWLKFGVDADSQLVAIEDAPSGKTNLTCPYCGGGLTAKKGRVKAHHFAHAEETCYPVAKRSFPTLPLYDNFNIRLSGKLLQQLKQLWREYGNTDYSIPAVPFRLVLEKIFVRNARQEGYDFTPLGKIPVGALPLAQFNQVQEPLLLEELGTLKGAAERAQTINSASLTRRLADLRLYRAQLRRILQLKLYFLQVRTDGETLHKIGVTRRQIEERVAEVERDLRKHYKGIDIEVLGTWEHRGNVELYFKHRYQRFNRPIGTLTEYFQFEEVEPVFCDLNRMGTKALRDEELEILQDEANGFF